MNTRSESLSSALSLNRFSPHLPGSLVRFQFDWIFYTPGRDLQYRLDGMVRKRRAEMGAGVVVRAKTACFARGTVWRRHNSEGWQKQLTRVLFDSPPGVC